MDVREGGHKRKYIHTDLVHTRVFIPRSHNAVHAMPMFTHHVTPRRPMHPQSWAHLHDSIRPVSDGVVAPAVTLRGGKEVEEVEEGECQWPGRS